jgi:tetratricopeptide (TPR) repeat protein
LAELCLFDDNAGKDKAYLSKARMLAPSNAKLLFHAGRLDFAAERYEQAYASWRRCLLLTHQYRDEIVRLAGEKLPIEEMIDQVLPDDPTLLVSVAQENYAAPEDEASYELLLQRAVAVIDQGTLEAGPRQQLLGWLRTQQKMTSEAISAYEEAIRLRPDQVEWRYELAVLLIENGMLEEARHHARWCARSQPRNRKFQQLLEQIVEQQLKS